MKASIRKYLCHDVALNRIEWDRNTCNQVEYKRVPFIDHRNGLLQEVSEILKFCHHIICGSISISYSLPFKKSPFGLLT